MTPTGSGRVAVVQQADGWWRWRFEPASADAEPLVSGEAYEDRDEAVESAAKAYPGHTLDVAEPAPRHRRLRDLIRQTVTAAVVAGAVIAAARAGNRRSRVADPGRGSARR
jgi:hypothetical protein